jgi:hypothetical protein
LPELGSQGRCYDAPRMSDLPAAVPAPDTTRRDRMVLGTVAVTVILGYVAAMFAATDGHFVAQITDLYLVCQYARAMAEGHAFHYWADEPASTGATSLLQTVILAVAHKVGLRGEALVAFAVVLGASLLLASTLLARRIALLLAGPREGLLAGILTALGGPVVWAFLYGSDVALFMFLALWLLHAMLVAWPAASPGPLVLPASLLAVARPEGLAIAFVLAATWLGGPGRRGTMRTRALILLPILAALSVLLLYKVLTGAWLGTSLSDKSLFDNYGFGQGIALVSEYLTDVVRGLLLGFYPSQAPVGFGRGWAPYYFAPLALVFILTTTILASATLRTPVLVWLGIVATLFVLVAPNMFLGSHFNRYLLWAFPTLHALTAAGLGLLCARLREPTGRRAFLTTSAVFTALGVLATARFGVMYGELAGEVYRRDLAAARWVAGNVPPGVPVANLATSVEYLTGHHNVNLHGVTSPAFFGARPAEREAGVFELLGRLPEAERPQFLMATTSALENYPSTRELIDPVPLFRTTSLSDEIVIHRMKLELVGRNRQMSSPEGLRAVSGLVEVDRLNVCDPRDEAAHGYSFRSELGDLRLSGTARIAVSPEGGVLIDGGRAILGRESFRVRTPERGRDLILVLRTAPDAAANVLRAGGSRQVRLEFAEGGLVVRANGEVAARTTVRPRPGWDEVVIRINRHLLRGETTDLEITGRYAAFQYWFYQ